MNLKVLEKYKRYLGNRYSSLKLAFELLSTNKKNIIVELGTSRSFVNSTLEGCMISDTKYWNEADKDSWDWGAGLFTRICSEVISGTMNVLYTIDPLDSAIFISKIITESFQNNIIYKQTDSTSFLHSLNLQIDLLYMDHHETCEEGAILHLEDCKVCFSRKLLTPNSIIIVDDTDFPDLGKGKYSIPFLKINGFRTQYEGYQTVLVYKN